MISYEEAETEEELQELINNKIEDAKASIYEDYTDGSISKGTAQQQLKQRTQSIYEEF